jgi:hypothetical protein
MAGGRVMEIDGYKTYLIDGIQVKAKLTVGGGFYIVVAPNGEEFTVLRQIFEKTAVEETEKKVLTYEEFHVLLDELNDEEIRMNRTIERMRVIQAEKREALMERKPNQ